MSRGDDPNEALADLELEGLGGADPEGEPDIEPFFQPEPSADLALDLGPGAEAEADADVELEADGDLELDLPGQARPATPRPRPESAALTGPWRDEEQLRRWALKAQDEQPWHPFVLLGEPATARADEARRRYEACAAYLRRLAEVGGQRGLLATLVRDDPAFRRLRDLDDARWAEEREAWRWARPLWEELCRDARRVAKDGRITEDEAQDMQVWAQRLGVPMGTLERWITERVVPEWPRLERVAAEPGGMHLKLIPGVTITSAAQFSEVARSSEERWRQASEAMETLRVILRNVSGPEADELRAAVEAGAARARAFAESSGRRFGEGEVNRLWLQCTLWVQEGAPGLALPDPWDAQVARSAEDLVRMADARPSVLEAALASGRLAAWLEATRAHPELARRLAAGEEPPEVALWHLLHSLGERRLRVGPATVSLGEELVEALDSGDAAVGAAFDSLLQRRVLQTWAQVTGQTATQDAAARAMGGQDGEHRRRVFCWALGSPALVPGVVELAELEELLRADPERFERLLGDGSISAWAMARGFLHRPPAEDQGWSAARRRQELLWSLGRTSLVLRDACFPSPGALVERLSAADEGAAKLLLHGEAAWEDGRIPRWLALHNAASPIPSELRDGGALRFALWRLGLSAFHHPDTGWLSDPAALAAWGERRHEALLRVLGESASAWLGVVAPQLFPQVMAALREHEELEDTAEYVLRALGRPAPTLSLSQDQVDLGRIIEGEKRGDSITLKNTSERGLLRLRLGEPRDALVKAMLGEDLYGQEHRLGPGESVTLDVMVSILPGAPSAGEDGVVLYVDGEPKPIAVRYHSSFDLASALRITALYIVVGATLTVGWRGLLAYMSGDTLLASDGGYLTDLSAIGTQPGAQDLSRLSVLAICLLTGVPLALRSALSVLRRLSR
ncbi:MAG: hypothetical protein H6741_05765 [Alphaproteobacteria bacterium]|nr:hypothetical protein [Alphaproteobacteria bacterium]MCB9792214.1 hypothetical protein [Alphaproteobacteria bacterium]